MTISETDPTKSASLFGGWVQAEGEPEGTFTTAEQHQEFMTRDFTQFAATSRTRWDLVECIKERFQRHKENKSPDKVG
jgi:hypothetical protein